MTIFLLDPLKTSLLEKITKSQTLCFIYSFTFIVLLYNLAQNVVLIDFFSHSVVQSLNCVQLCDTMDCSTPVFPVLQHFLAFAQIQVLWVGDAIQPSQPLLSPSPPALHLSQHEGLLQWVSSSDHVVRVLELQLHTLRPHPSCFMYTRNLW